VPSKRAATGFARKIRAIGRFASGLKTCHKWRASQVRKNGQRRRPEAR
jgi:hypothetical protein